jgi:multidrug efflux pump subunit AcrA (membrane-fusion protein)
VVTGVRTDSRVQVVTGLRAGEAVVTSGLQQIREGSLVELELADPPLSSAAAGYR